MNVSEKIKLLERLGHILQLVGSEKSWPGFELGINKEEYDELVELTYRVHIYNGWFTPVAVKEAFLGIAAWLTEEKLQQWVEKYNLNEGKPKRVALIMAGNIPLVGFHDFLAVFLSGHKAIVKLSSDDKHLFPALLSILKLFNQEIVDWVEIKEQKLEHFDAVIATGSDNSATYFHSYFGRYPNIIRKNRTSIAVLTGEETKAELTELGKDVFNYFGLGCRNVSQIVMPKDFDLDRVFEAFYPFNPIVNHNKYANNYDYNRAVYLMNLEEILDNGFLLLKEDQKLNSPLGMLHYWRYENKGEVDQFIAAHEDRIQAVIGTNYIPFGKSQSPQLEDYADGVDTLAFLSGLK